MTTVKCYQVAHVQFCLDKYRQPALSAFHSKNLEWLWHWNCDNLHSTWTYIATLFWLNTLYLIFYFLRISLLLTGMLWIHQTHISCRVWCRIMVKTRCLLLTKYRELLLYAGRCLFFFILGFSVLEWWGILDKIFCLQISCLIQLILPGKLLWSGHQFDKENISQCLMLSLEEDACIDKIYMI